MSGSIAGNKVIDSGSDSILLHLAEDSSLGTDAEFTVSVDGQQVGGVQTVTADQAKGQTDAFTVEGDWSPGPHAVTIAFANHPDLSGQGDLYIEGVSYDGQTVSSTQTPIYPLNVGYTTVYGSTSYTVQDTTAVPAAGSAPPGNSTSSSSTTLPTLDTSISTPNNSANAGTVLTGNNNVGSALDLSGYHLSFDWEANNFSNSPTPQAGSFTTTLSSGLRSLGNGDQEYWTDSSTGQNPYTLSNGVLNINATSVGAGNTPGGGNLSYDSGVFSTQGMFSQQYGYFEMRAELPAGAGMWPAFWMLDNNANQTGGWPPELDALEAFGAPAPDGEGGTNQAHWDVHSQNTSEQAGAWQALNSDATTSFHTYGVLWTPSTMSFVYDGNVVAQTPTPSDYTQAMYMIVDLAVGGTWPGNATGENAAMKVDYLRAFSSDAGVPAVALQAISSPDGGGTSLYGATTAKGSTAALSSPQVSVPLTTH